MNKTLLSYPLPLEPFVKSDAEADKVYTQERNMWSEPVPHHPPCQRTVPLLLLTTTPILNRFYKKKTKSYPLDSIDHWSGIGRWPAGKVIRTLNPSQNKE